MKRALMVIALGVACVGGCSTGGRMSEVAEPSGFLGDYSGLRASPRHAGTMYQQSPRLAQYRSFMVDPIKVLPAKTVRGQLIDSATAEGLARELRDEVIQALGMENTIVESPGPGVARIRGAITRVARSRGMFGRIAVGGAAMEVEITDSVTGERLGAAMESDEPDTVYSYNAPGEVDQYYDARMAFRHWAARLHRWLDGARSGEVPPTMK